MLLGMSEIVKNPRVMEEAQADVRREFDRKGYVSYAGLVYLVFYMVCVIFQFISPHLRIVNKIQFS